MARAIDHPDRLWRSSQPRKAYDAVIVGGGGHGLATAHYLATVHGMTDVAVCERGWLGGGNMARNTSIIRSNYLWDESASLYDHALRLWEGLAEELDYDFELSQRGVLNLAHNLHDEREGRRRVAANRVNGIDSEWLDVKALGEYCPVLNLDPGARYPVAGASLQRRGGIARHDAVAWALARSASNKGIDLVEGCEVLDVKVDGSGVTGLRTTLGDIATRRVALAAAGSTSILADRIGLPLPIQTRPLQALVSEILEPVLDCVVMSNAVHVYVSQAHKGELVLGAGVDAYNSYAQRGSFHVIEEQLAAACELFPIFAGAHVLRTWAGIVDVTPDASPIIGSTPIDGLFVNCGWGTGGFKATPGVGSVYAHVIATGEPHPIAQPFALDRFTRGALIDEHGAAAVAH